MEEGKDNGKESRKRIWITGAAGNLGVNLTRKLAEKHHVLAIDNFSRTRLLGGADIKDNLRELYTNPPGTIDIDTQDIRTIDWEHLMYTWRFGRPDVIIHSAAQVSHPYSIENPRVDFEINALGTFRILEYLRNISPSTQLIHIGTAKIYGRNVDMLVPYDELNTRFWYKYNSGLYPNSFQGVTENCSFDQTLKTPFGCSKACADLYVQEYGKLYGLQTSVLRPGVFTGKYAKPAIYQNWLGDLMKEVLTQDHVDIIGWKGKQVRDVLHTDDLVDAIVEMIDSPPPKGEVYNISGGMNNTISVIEAFDKICEMSGRHPTHSFTETRPGDWCVYVGDNSKLQKQYPQWQVKRNLDYIFQELYETLAPNIVEKNQ